MKKLFKFGGTDVSSTYSWLGGILMFGLWWIITLDDSIVSSRILSNPIDSLLTLPDLIKDGLFGNILYTVGLNWLGYFYALLVAIPVGLGIGIFPLLRAVFRPILEALRYIPLPVVSGIFIAALGLGFDMKAKYMAFGMMLFTIPLVIQEVLNLQDTKNEKDYVYIQTAKTMGMSSWQMFRYIYWPYVSEKIYSGIRQLVAISYNYVVSAECLNKEGGIGAMISTLTRQSRMSEVYMLIFIIMMIGVLQDYSFKVCEPLLFKHKK